jgi:serine/threonine protein phosphatase PrpC
MSPARVLTFRTHKVRETENACEDSVYPGPGESSQEFFAVADGATQSFYSRIWAQKLTSRFAEKGQDAFENWGTWIKGAQEAWRKEVAAEVEKRPEDVYTTNGFNERRPAAATFVGLQLLPAQTRDVVAWRALVIGDSCLFHLSSKGNVSRYPKQKAVDFTFITDSIESYPRSSEQMPTRLTTF